MARCSIGFWIGLTTRPERWWLRAPLVGFLVMLPLGIVLLATPGCEGRCTMWNLTTGTGVGALVAGLAFGLTAGSGSEPPAHGRSQARQPVRSSTGSRALRSATAR